MQDELSSATRNTDKGQGPSQAAGDRKFGIQPPTISLPQGGGAIKGIGEKFAANPVTGTGSMTVPIATSPGRSGFGPQLALSYDSGASNGIFGMGWSMALPAIARKTDKGLPQYLDGSDSDVFILSGAEDLVPVLLPEGGIDEGEREGYRIRRYRPRVEGVFARIERWTDLATGDTHWRSISKDNITTLYGKTAESRIADPSNPEHVFRWLICESYDDKGNALVYRYKAEDSVGVDLLQVHERNRTEESRSANRYLKRILYGNKVSSLGRTDLETMEWLFEVVLDYGDHDLAVPLPQESQPWTVRNDPFSSYRPGFEVRTYRLCQRVLMFHHFPDEAEVEKDCLVRSTDLTYRYEQAPDHDHNPIYSKLTSVFQRGYKRQPGGGYFQRSLPPLEFTYSEADIDETVHDVEPKSLENLPMGLDGQQYRWVDLDGEGLSGILTEQGGGWFYKRNLSPGEAQIKAKFAPVEVVDPQPAMALAGGAQFLDLAGDGQPDVVNFQQPTPGFYERTFDEGWKSFVPFKVLPHVDWADPNLRFIDLNGDGHTDLLITENDCFVWYASKAEAGFGPAARVRQPWDEEQGPRVVFADSTQSVVLADLSGDGLTDIARIRNGEVCYWPNLGYGRFGAKVTMDDSPWFDTQDQFDQRRIQLADIDGSGTTDILYLSGSGVQIYFNQSGNRWSAVRTISGFPAIDSVVSVTAFDLLGNGTACLVWSSPLPGDTSRAIRYINLMGQGKPHLLTKTINNLGAETVVHYAPSTQFYVQDRLAGRPWITKLPFPVHVVERVETYDHVSRNRFVMRYAYHHGYFDGVEREFRGFGMVEQWDTEAFATLENSSDFPIGDNVNQQSHVPPVYSKTWFHTGVYLYRDRVSNYFAGLKNDQDIGEYYREPDLTDNQTQLLLLEDTVLPAGLTVEEEREACRALRGSMLRQEVYALDDTEMASHPYTATEQNFAVQMLQPRNDKHYGVFFTHSLEALNYHYERNPADPRVSHAITLEVNKFGNVLKEVAIAYGRRQPDPSLPLIDDQEKQTQVLITYTENRFTHPINTDSDYRTPLPAETLTYELTGFVPTGTTGRFQLSDFVQPDPSNPNQLIAVFDNEVNYEDSPTNGKQRRLIEQARTLYRPNDFGAAQNDVLALLPLGEVESLAIPGESYQLAFTPGLLSKVFQRRLPGQAPDLPPETLLPNPDSILGGAGPDQGGYVDLDGNKHWWIPAGRMFYSPNNGDAPIPELDHARRHFFVPHRARDPFHTDAVSTETSITYDKYDLLLSETLDPVGNRVTVGERDTNDFLVTQGNNYRVLQPQLVMDPNRNRTAIAFDALGMVVGTAVMGKPAPSQEGDSLEIFEPDLTQAQIDGFYNAIDPHVPAIPLLGTATTRILYDLDRFWQTRQANADDPSQWLPIYTATIARETHVNAPLPPEGLKVQISFSYSDGFGREIQQKIQAEPEKTNGGIGSARWVGSGWTIFNNKGKSVRQYEPFFSQLPPGQRHHFEFAPIVGVSPVLFYDPLERVVATLHPNHTYEKVLFTPWQQVTYDVNDTVAAQGDETGDPRTDRHIQGYVKPYFDTQPTDWQTWYARRQGGDLGAQEQQAANKAAAHANTPTTAYLDTLGRPFLTVAHNRVVCPNHDLDGSEAKFPTRVELDIEGNQRTVRDAIIQADDALGRIVMLYDYDLLGNRIHQSSMEAGERWILNNVVGEPIRAWDSRRHIFRTEYDPIRRPIRIFVKGADSAAPTQEVLTERLIYGEQHPEAETQNLRGQIYLHLDQAGAVTNEVYDFKGNLLSSSRRLATEYKRAINWSTADLNIPSLATDAIVLITLEAALEISLEDEIFTGHTSFDALNRPIQMIAPRSNQIGARRNVIQPGYNEANLLERMDVWLDHPSDPDGLLNRNSIQPSPVGVENINYDAKGQRIRIDYKNGATTHYDYDEETFRLVHLYTRRGATFVQDCGNSPGFASPDHPPKNTPCGLQNLHYFYDPVGNITYIRDDAQQTVFFRNRVVEPSSDYTYDATYRLIQATGRDHLGQTGEPIPHSYNDEFRVNRPHPNDGDAMGRYCENYVYDAVGNFIEMSHHGSCSDAASWVRNYTYTETSLIEYGTGGTLSKTNNRLSNTTIGARREFYNTLDDDGYDAHGNMLRMPQLQLMQWDYKNQLQMTQAQRVNGEDTSGLERQGERTYYVYDSAGHRVRKITELTNGNLSNERIYLGGFEIYRKKSGNYGHLERESLQIMDDMQVIALIETRNDVDDGTGQQLIRYQLGNHQGSISLELDSQANIISYEEYTPYGNSTFQAVRNQTKSPKKYRYSGKERDEESGLYYHKTRYYASWIGRWSNTDPTGISGGINLFVYAADSPINFVDLNGELPILPILLKAGAGGASDLMIQVTMSYYFNPEVKDIGEAYDKVDWLQVGRSTLEGAIPWKTPGGKLGKAAATATVDIIQKAVSNSLNDKEYDLKQASQDFAAGFISQLGGDALGDLVAKYGTDVFKSGLKRMGFSDESILKIASRTRSMAEKDLEVTTRRASKLPGPGSPVQAGATHIDSGVTATARNTRPENLDQKTLKRIKNYDKTYLEMTGGNKDSYHFFRKGKEVAHAEKVAVAKVELQMENTLGRRLTEKEKSRIIYHPINKKKGSSVPPCAGCSIGLEGYSSSINTQQSIKEQLDEVLKGKYEKKLEML